MEGNMSDKKEHGQDALEIVNDPKNRVSAKDVLGDAVNEANVEITSGVSRRNLLKYGAGAAAVLSVAGSAATGFATGRSAEAYTGSGRTTLGKDQFFNREPFRAEVPAMMDDKVGNEPYKRVDWRGIVFERRNAVVALMKSKQWNPSMGVEAMPGSIGDYYRENPKSLEWLLKALDNFAKAAKHFKTTSAREQYSIFYAYESAYKQGLTQNDHLPPNPRMEYSKTKVPITPEEWDYRGVEDRKFEFQSPAHAAKLIKNMAHVFGASVAAVTKLDERFVFADHMRGLPDNGHGQWGDKIPSHWKSVIVFAVPMHWDMTASVVNYSCAYDGYHKVRSVAGLMEAFIKKLGYPARAQVPGNDYEIMMTPHVLLSGLGEYARAGYAMVPELGSNFKPAAVITDIEFDYDKPININMASFCKKCKICADTCPSGAIETTEEPTQVVRGYKRWKLDEDKCFAQWWGGALTSSTCGVCLGVCPFTRKNTWIHAISRELDARDATGIVGSTLLAMQLNFFKYPTGEEFRAKWDGGREAVYHNPPWWMRPEDFFKDIEVDWEYDGMH